MEKMHKLPLPIGSIDYKEISRECYYIDKTLLIKDILDERTKIFLFTRPRRFGKTLNMDMLRTFFEKTDEDTSKYFQDKKIWAQGESYTNHQGRYPVIFLSFKDAKQNSWEEMYDELKETIKDEYYRHYELKDSTKLKDKAYFNRILAGEGTKAELSKSILRLSEMLCEHYGEKVVLIIDEYDTPIQSGHFYKCYDDVINFMRNMLSSALKDNNNIAFGFLTGILRVAKESIFSGLNNIKVYSVLDRKFNAYFGFTNEEVAEMAHYYGLEEKLTEIKEWYDGYNFGGLEIYNPWSVVNYFDNDCLPIPYWVQTSSNLVIYEMMSYLSRDIFTKLQEIISGKSINYIVDMNIVYPEIKDRPENIFAFLLMTGYMKAVRTTLTPFGDRECELCIPNRELLNVYHKEIVTHLSANMSLNTAYGITKAILQKNVAQLKEYLNTFLLQAVSYHDTLNENYYHGLLLGMTLLFHEQYFVRSNRESGNGRYDIALEPKSSAGLPGIIIEVKAKRDDNESLAALAQKALAQIEEKQYDTEMKSRGIKTTLKYGIAFYKKDVEIATK